MVRRTNVALLLLVLGTSILAGCGGGPSPGDEIEGSSSQVEVGTQVTIQVNWTSGDSSSLEHIVVNLCPLRPNHIASFLAARGWALGGDGVTNVWAAQQRYKRDRNMRDGTGQGRDRA